MREEKKLLEVGKKFVKRNWGRKKKLQVPIYVDLNSDNKQSKKKQKEKLNMVEVVYEEKKIDIEIQKIETELRKKLVEKTENEANCYYELVIIEAKE